LDPSRPFLLRRRPDNFQRFASIGLLWSNSINKPKHWLNCVYNAMESLADTDRHYHHHRHEEHTDSSPRGANHPRPAIDTGSNIRTTYHDATNEEAEDDSASSTSLLGGDDPESHRRTKRRQFQEDHFYVRVVDAFNGWRKTRRKSWRTFGRFAFTLLKELIFSPWTIKVSIIGFIFRFSAG
jgi:hypothetical protein